MELVYKTVLIIFLDNYKMSLKRKLEIVTSNVSSFGLFEVFYNTQTGRRVSVRKLT